MEILINNNKYKIIKDFGSTVSTISFNDIVTEYYDNFDFIVGDWAYGKVRLKGFYNHDNKNCKNYNDIKDVDNYIKNNCAYGCKYFILEKQKNNDIEKSK